jgi:hypothetical protein
MEVENFETEQILRTQGITKNIVEVLQAKNIINNFLIH